MARVIKRDGERVLINGEKIQNAIEKAAKATYNRELMPVEIYNIQRITYDILTVIDTEEDITVEEIQDIVEEFLMCNNMHDVAKNYILYRAERSRVRQLRSDLITRIREKLDGLHDEKQNANLDEKSFGGRKGEADSVMMKELALYGGYMSEQSAKLHTENIVYIHDLDHFVLGDHNCLTCPIDDLLANGFNTRQTDIRPAQSVNTAFQLIAVIFQLQSLCQFGGVSASHLDWSLVPYVRKSFFKHFRDGMKYVEEEELPDNLNDTLSIEDKLYKIHKKAYKYAYDMTEKEVRQGAEGLYHNLNSLQSRSGNQLPFSSINYGTCTSTEGRMVTKALLEASIEGVGAKHKTSVFPCGIFQMKKGVNRKPGDKNYDLFRLALKSTALRLYPNYANCDWSGNAGYDENDPRTYFSTINKTVA